MDVNDNNRTAVGTALQQDNLLIQSTADLNILSLAIVPDTISTGQENVIGTMVYTNAAAGPVQINRAQLSSSTVGVNFTANLIGKNTPYTIGGNSTDTLRYLISSTKNLFTGPTDVVVSGIMNGIDLNSGQITADTIQTSYYLQSPAKLVWAGLIEPLVFDNDTTISFRVRMANTGEAAIVLDSNATYLDLITTNYDTILLSGLSPRTVAGGDTIDLIFRPTYITGVAPADYAVQLTANGSSTSKPYTATIATGQITIGGDVYFNGGSVVPAVVLQGQQNVTVNMIIGNDGTPLPIDVAGTTVSFRKSGVAIVPQPALTRADVLDTLSQTPFNTLIFTFNAPQSVDWDGTIEVWGQLSLDGGVILKNSQNPITTFEVSSGTKPVFVNGSLSEDQVVPRQTVSFSLTLADTGTSGLTLIPDSTYLQIIAGSDTLKTQLSSRYTIPAGDSSRISFLPLLIPSGLRTGPSDGFVLRLGGRQINGSIKIDTLDLGTLQILRPAAITIVNIDVVPDIVLQGQENVQVNYMLRNDGQSPAQVRNILKRFSRLQDSLNVSAGWVLSSVMPELGNGNLTQINPGNSQVFDARYVLAAQADTGLIVPHPRVTYNDSLTAAFIDTAQTLAYFDTVRVIRPARLRIDSLIVLKDSLAPNKPNVNINKSFNMRLYLSNTGVDSARNIAVTVLQNTVSRFNRLFDRIGPESQFVFDTTLTLSSAGDFTFVARIDSAFTATTGNRITPGQPIDNREDIHADTPVYLAMNSRISGPLGALDGIVSAGQLLTVEATLSNSGSASYNPGRLRLGVPAAYTVVSRVDTAFSQALPTVSWIVRANSVTAGYDSLTITVTDSAFDRNINAPALINTAAFNRYIPVRTENAASFSLSQRIVSPAGATDGTLSTAQTFNVAASIGFIGNVLDTARVAQILLPAGYSVADSVVKPLMNGVDSVAWQVIARNDSSKVLESLRIRVSGIDGNSGQPVQVTSSALQIQTVKRAEIFVSAAISAPSGATDGKVSAGQWFDIKTIIGNAGRAAVDSIGQVSINLPANYSLDPMAGNDPLRNYTVDDSVIWRVLAGSVSAGKTAMTEARALLSEFNSLTAVGTVQIPGVAMVTEKPKQLAEQIIALVAENGNTTVKSDQIAIKSGFNTAG